MAFIIKADLDTDLYAEWSTSTNLPEFIGTRAESAAYLAASSSGASADDPNLQLDRADATGCSRVPARQPTYTWDTTPFTVDNAGFIERPDLTEFLTLYQSDEEAALAFVKTKQSP
jgi:hypothetical protein